MSDDLMTDLSRLMPASPAGELHEDRLLILKEHLMAEYRLAADTELPAHSSTPKRAWRLPRWSRRRPLIAAGAAALTAAAAATALVVTLAGGGPAPASPAAVRLLAEVAVAAGRQSAPTVSNSDFMYIRSDVAFMVYENGSQTGIMEPLHERQIWLPVANLCDYGLLIEEGQRTSLEPGDGLSPPSGANCGPGNLGDPTYRLLQSLPTDPHALLSAIYAWDQGRGSSQLYQEIGPSGAAFETIGDVIREMIVPPATAAALYRAAALIPGVTLIGRVANADGRAGIAVAWTGSQDRYEWIFDPSTLQFIGERDFDMSTGKPVATGYTAVLQRAFVAKAGELP